MRRKTPRQKKKLSYSKDRRNTYGENSRSSRKGIPRHRARKHRKYRHSVNQAIKSALGTDLMESDVKEIRRENWEKKPDVPLGKIVAAKKLRRIATGQQRG